MKNNVMKKPMMKKQMMKRPMMSEIKTETASIVDGSIDMIKHPLDSIRFKLKDILQVLIGASILAIPVALTEETWTLGSALPMTNIIGLFLLSLIFISTFTYYHYHKQYRIKGIRGHWKYLIKRVASTYVLAFATVSIILILIQKAPYLTDTAIAFKRAVIVAFPASMTAVIADTLK